MANRSEKKRKKKKKKQSSGKKPALANGAIRTAHPPKSPNKNAGRVRSTIGLLIRQLQLQGNITECPSWPPDAFAIAATILESTGSYERVVCKKWPPDETNIETWCKKIRKLGLAWWDTGKLPNEVKIWWKEIANAQDLLLSEIPNHADNHDSLICALLQICAVADESCSGIGLPGTTDLSNKESEDSEDDDALKNTENPTGNLSPEQRHRAGEFFSIANKQLLKHNLCRNIDPSVAKVIPKVQTPQVGFNLRSLTHNIALWRNPAVSPHWHSFPSLSLRDKKTKSLNLLLIPWPYNISADQFSAVKHDEVEMHDCHQFFKYKPDEIEKGKLVGMVTELLNQIGSTVKDIDAVVFPELSLTTENYDYLSIYLAQRGLILIAGTASEKENAAKCSFPNGKSYSTVNQNKHHRWKIDKDQVLQYRLGSSLGTDCDWWEDMTIKSRTVNFFPVHYWLTFCVLICEDLARQDPVATLVRAVGPNLVIALLMDGPQVRGRWSDRYASVLSDDPGSSVLSFTSVGMALRSHKKNSWELEESNGSVIALWRDSINGATEITLNNSSAAVVISMNTVTERQFTADGREADEYPRNILILSGIHQITGDR